MIIIVAQRFDEHRINSALYCALSKSQKNSRKNKRMAFKTIQPKILYFGTPVVLLTTVDENEHPNIAPMSSAWALGWSILLGLGTSGKTFENLSHTGEVVLNFPTDALYKVVEALAPLTGKHPVPLDKQPHFRYEPNKFDAVGLTRLASEIVKPPRVEECPLQFEAVVEAIHSMIGNQTAAIEVRVVRVHAQTSIILDEHHIDPHTWQPLIYNFRHYFGLSTELGKSFRSET